MNYDAMITFATQLAETVQSAKSTAAELASAREEMAALQRKLDSLAADRDGIAARLEHSQESCARLAHERDEVAFAHLEASEALAEANAKLNSFRKLLGMDDREGAAGAVPAAQPAVDADVQEANPGSGAAVVPETPPQPVVPEAPPGTGGVEQDHAAALSAPEVAQVDPIHTGLATVAVPDGSSSDTVTESPFSSSPTPAPEVTEPRPTSAGAGTGSGNTEGAEEHGQTEPSGPISWRDSPGYVGYRPFGV